jgi:hypothetical protein
LKQFNFPRTIKRKLFNIIFGGIGKRRLITDYNPKRKPLALQFRMVWIRRSHQGWRNRVYGSIIAIKLRLQYGRRKGVPQFRR